MLRVWLILIFLYQMLNFQEFFIFSFCDALKQKRYES